MVILILFVCFSIRVPAMFIKFPKQMKTSTIRNRKHESFIVPSGRITLVWHLIKVTILYNEQEDCSLLIGY